jgi:tripartite-type tricarboxylate transporter receptor subunit TctC
MIPRRHFLRLAASATALLALPQLALAQPYPSRSITIIVPYAAGGPADALARILGERMRATLGQTILIENVTGASGTIGVTRAV